jgi:hypothetical protein
VAEVLRAIISAYRDLFKAASLTDGVLLANYALAVLVVDEVCKEVGGWVGAWMRACGRAGCSNGWAPLGGLCRCMFYAASQRCICAQPVPATAALGCVCRAW